MVGRLGFKRSDGRGYTNNPQAGEKPAHLNPSRPRSLHNHPAVGNVGLFYGSDMVVALHPSLVAARCPFQRTTGIAAAVV